MLKGATVSRTVTDGLLSRVDTAVDGRRMESFTLENEIVFVIDPKEDLI